MQQTNHEGLARLRRGILAVVIALAAIAAAVSAARLWRGGASATAPRLPHRAGPRAVVDCTPWDLGVIESGEQFTHVFTICNQGDAPLALAPGRKLCACTVTSLPQRPIPPGGTAEVHVSFTESVKHEVMKHGRFSRGVLVLTNDPEQAEILLAVNFTVNRRLLALPPDATLSIDSSGAVPPEERTADLLVYSERWDRFQLSVARSSREGIQWRLDPVAQGQLGDPAARSGYRVAVTLPQDLPEGPLAEWIELVGTPEGRVEGSGDRDHGSAGSVRGTSARESAPLAPGPSPPETLRIPIHGSVHGRLEMHSPKLVGQNLLLLGALRQSRAAHETVFVKINDDRHELAARRIETQPPFLQARFAPYRAGADRLGLYRIDLEIPADAPSCAFTSPHRGWIRLRTDHPRLSLIELRVDFCIVAAQ
jgi:hypothetical protein